MRNWRLGASLFASCILLAAADKPFTLALDFQTTAGVDRQVGLRESVACLKTVTADLVARARKNSRDLAGDWTIRILVSGFADKGGFHAFWYARIFDGENTFQIAASAFDAGEAERIGQNAIQLSLDAIRLRKSPKVDKLKPSAAR